MTALLACIAAASHKSTRVLSRRFPRAEAELTHLLRSGFVEYADVACEAYRVTMAGRAELRRLREASAVARSFPTISEVSNAS